jgi:hypothetical protein
MSNDFGFTIVIGWHFLTGVMFIDDNLADIL